MALAQPSTQTQMLALQTLGLSQVHIKGPEDDILDDSLADGLDDGSDYGLDDLISGYTARKPDERKEIEVVGEHKFSKLLEKYELFLRRKDYFIKDKEILDWIEDVLSVEDINTFLQLTIRFEDYKEYSRETGLFITRLIKNSYNAGYNNFVINTMAMSKSLDNLGENFCGLPYRMIYVQIDGDVGKYCGSNAFCSSFTINGNAELGCGHKIWNSILIINGDVDDKPSLGARYSSFTINGNVDEADNWEYETISCIFKTPNKGTLGKLLGYNRIGSKNKYYFINPDGTEELIFGVLNE